MSLRSKGGIIGCRTFTIMLGTDIELGDVVGRGRLNPHCLPDTRARAIKDMARVQSLLSNGDGL
jgi:hypothetical protein